MVGKNGHKRNTHGYTAGADKVTTRDNSLLHIEGYAVEYSIFSILWYHCYGHWSQGAWERDCAHHEAIPRRYSKRKESLDSFTDSQLITNEHLEQMSNPSGGSSSDLDSEAPVGSYGAMLRSYAKRTSSGKPQTVPGIAFPPLPSPPLPSLPLFLPLSLPPSLPLLEMTK